MSALIQENKMLKAWF